MAHEQRREISGKETSWNTIQIVHLQETFPLFHLGRNGTTIRYTDDLTFGGVASRIRLQTGLLDLLNISIVTAPYALQRTVIMAPFERSRGYPLDEKDFSWRSRYKKILHMKRELSEIVEGLGLLVFVAYEDFPFFGNGQGQAPTFASGTGQGQAAAPTFLERVFLTLYFPDGSSFTARARCNTGYGQGQMRGPTLLFRTFFPTDTGPLPVGDPLPTELDSLSIEEGFRILLPFDAEQVQTIRAKFLLLPEL